MLVIGGSGSLGTYAVQFAKHAGPVVHAVCSGRNAKLVESLGTDRVFDCTSEDFTTSGERTTSSSTPSVGARSPAAGGC